MSNEGERMSLLEESKSKAIAMVQSMPLNTKFILFYHGMTYSPYRFWSSEEMQKQISDIHPSPITFKWSHVFNTLDKAIQSLHLSTNVQYVFFSDGQKYAVDYTTWLNVNAHIYLFLASSAKRSNIAIDTLWMEHPNHIIGQHEKMTVKITNYGDDDFKALPVRLFINDTLKTMSTVTVNAHSSETVEFTYVNLHQGFANGRIELSDFPIIFDNVYYFNYRVCKNIKVAVISNEPSPYFNSFFSSDSVFNVSTFSPKNLPYSTLIQYQFILVNAIDDLSSGLWSTLLSAVKQGSSLLIVPSVSDKIPLLNSYLKEIGLSLEQKDTAKRMLSVSSAELGFYKGVFTKNDEHAKMPWVKNGFRIISAHGLVSDILLNYENMQPALSKTAMDKGTLYLIGFTFSPKTTDFMTHPLFVSILHRMAQLSIRATALSYTLSPDLSVMVAADSVMNEDVLELKQPKTGQSVIPLQRRLFNEIALLPQDAVTEDGFYQLWYQHQLKTWLSFNYDRKESDQTYYTMDEIKRFLEDKNMKVSPIDAVDTDEIKAIIGNEIQGKSFWKMFALLALLFLTGEMLVIRLWKK
jgi:hypothetical protein